MKYLQTLVAAFVVVCVFGSCGAWKGASNQEKGAVIGAAGGAVAGGVVGKVAGNTAAGAVIGTVVGGVAGAIIGRRMDKQAEEIEKSVPGAEVERVGEGIVLNFQEKVLFGFNQSTLNTQAYAALDKLVPILKKYPDTWVQVYGHTDNIGSDSYNQSLSERRAQAVENYLVSRGIGNARIDIYGRGESFPKCTNNTEEGRACNRRVEFAIVANEKMQREAIQESKQ